MSVATSTCTLYSLKSSSARVRAPCDLLPWIAAHCRPSCVSCSARRFAPCLVRVKTSVCGDGAALQQVAQHGALLALRHQVHAVLDQLGRGIARCDFDRERVAQQSVRESADVLRERRREQQVLAVRRQHREHATDVADEAHVEHAVGLVEDEVTHAAQVDVALVGVVEQAARRGDDDVDAATQQVDLRTRADAAEDQRRLLAQVHAEIGDGLLDLRREFAGRNQHERTRRSRTARVRLVLVQLLQQRQRKRRRLAGARLGGRKQVTAFEHRGDAARLDGGRLRVAHFDDRTHEFGLEAEVFK